MGKTPYCYPPPLLHEIIIKIGRGGQWGHLPNVPPYPPSWDIPIVSWRWSRMRYSPLSPPPLYNRVVRKRFPHYLPLAPFSPNPLWSEKRKWGFMKNQKHTQATIWFCWNLQNFQTMVELQKTYMWIKGILRSPTIILVFSCWVLPQVYFSSNMFFPTLSCQNEMRGGAF